MRAAALALAAAVLAVYPEPAAEAHFAPTGLRHRLQSEIAREIAKARREILVAMFHFTSDRLARALAERRREGATVRVLLDAEQSDPDFVRGLRDDGIEVRRVTPRGEEGPRFHHKYAVLDGRTVLTGSYNWTVMGDRSNHENLLILRGEEIAQKFLSDFKSVWDDTDISRP